MEVWDTSALIAATRDPSADGHLSDALAEDAVAITEAILLEYLNGARNLGEYVRFETALRSTRILATESSAWERALSVHRRLAATGPGHQRSVRLVDLLVAAVAEANGLAVVHIDEDYERIASITGQATRRLTQTDSRARLP